MAERDALMSDDYHDYVIKDGRFVGRFDEMYRRCADPWPESEADLDGNPVSLRTAALLRANGHSRVFSLGCGKGAHLQWLAKRCPGLEFAGCDISPTAVAACRERLPGMDARVLDVEGFCRESFDFDLLLLREIVWYILPDWDRLCGTLAQRYPGRHIVVEQTFYDNQSYGNAYFNGPSAFVRKFPFKIVEILRHHVTKRQREGMMLVYGQM